MMRDLFQHDANTDGNALLHDTRASSVNIGFIIQVGITTIVILGVIAGVTTVVDNQQNRAVDHQATVIGEQVAASTMAADRVAGVGERTNITLNRELPGDVVGTPYIVRLQDGPDGPYIFVNVIGQDAESKIPINIDATVTESSVSGASNMEIVVVTDPSTGDTEIKIQQRTEEVIS